MSMSTPHPFVFRVLVVCFESHMDNLPFGRLPKSFVRRVRGSVLCRPLVLLSLVLSTAVACYTLSRILHGHYVRPRDSASAAAFAAAVSPIISSPTPAICTSPPCFVRYEPSEYEASWALNAASWAPIACAKLEEPKERELSSTWLDLGTSLLRDPTLGVKGGALSLPGASLLSRLVFADETGAETAVAVHPLAGILRDPRGVCPGPYRDIQSKDFLILDPAGLALTRGRRAILLDAGATRWSDTDMEGLRWLVSTFGARGVVFDEILAWEARPQSAFDFFEGMPPSVVARTHFYNMPINAVPGGARNPLTLLKSIATPADFVVFKLDIDTEDLEEELLVQLLGDAEATGLVDMLFFEHHTSLPAMAPWWGTIDRASHKDSMQLFAALRARGILAQSWP